MGIEKLGLDFLEELADHFSEKKDGCHHPSL
jgi:hypothetical protein